MKHQKHLRRATKLKKRQTNGNLARNCVQSVSIPELFVLKHQTPGLYQVRGSKHRNEKRLIKKASVKHQNVEVRTNTVSISWRRIIYDEYYDRNCSWNSKHKKLHIKIQLENPRKLATWSENGKLIASMFYA